MSEEVDGRFLSRLRSVVATAKAWDADPVLLAECRAMIPPTLFQESSDTEQQPDDDTLYRGNALYLKRLTRYFQKQVMTWVNAPACRLCQGETECVRTRGPETAEEREGAAGRVEVFKCKTCQDSTTTFPRYNSVRKLLQTRQGRCGEYANLFGLFCRAVGFETRYVSDWTDHVWVEVLIDSDHWIMADACEGIIDKPSMYESGWDKKLNCIVGATTDSVTDVTPRYTRQWQSMDFHARRREVTSSEQTLQQMVQQYNATLRQPLSKPRRDELDRLAKLEQGQFARMQQAIGWTEDEKHGKGRISGSLQWKLSRQEAGNADVNDSTQTKQSVRHVESVFPQEDIVTLAVTADGNIVVSGVECSTPGMPFSVVIVDDKFGGCILQSRGFAAWKDVNDFVMSLPKYRIVILKGTGKPETTSNKAGLSRLGGFVAPKDDQDVIFYIGQVEAQPDWTICTYKATGIQVQFPSKTRHASLRLRTERMTLPRRVATRLPEKIMPLQTQLLATEEQKRAAFLKFVERHGHSKRYLGYTTKPNVPIYLLDSSAYPFERSDGDWNTFHFLPEPLVPKDDVGIVETMGGSRAHAPTFDVPLASSFFIDLLGPNLLVKTENAAPVLIDTPSALHNARLVALYFSAHWCGPCRSFTPMLIELYAHLKEEFPTHGLEIVFVSSDRDVGSFQGYFGSMPWCAIPFTNPYIQQIKTRYEVRGIPALVVLDTMSGQIVIPMSETRTEVMRACQGGDEHIEDMLMKWIGRIPHESKEIMDLLELSCAEDQQSGNESPDISEHPYLVRSIHDGVDDVVDPSIKEIFSKLVLEGSDPNAADAKAIQLVADEQKVGARKSFDVGPWHGHALSASPPEELPTIQSAVDQAVSHVLEWNRDAGIAAIQTVVSTIQKYVDNARREPWTFKYRSFRLSNKVVDRITRVEGGLDLICSLGLYIYGSEQDFMACIPVGANLDEMNATMTRILEAHCPR